MKKDDSLKIKLNRLNKIIENSNNPVILIYNNPDPDSLASAWGLREIFRKANRNAVIAYTGEVSRLENEAMINYLRIPVIKLNEEILAKAGLLALVDAQPNFFLSEEIVKKIDIIIDHHPQKSESRFSAAFADVRARCVSTSSILTEYLLALGISINRRLATALLYGVQTDSLNIYRSPSQTDLLAINYLLRRADQALLRKIEFSCYSLSRLNYFSIALIKLRHSPNVLYSDIGLVPSADVCSQIADFLIRVKEAHWAMVSGVINRKLIIVFRCDGQQRNAGQTAYRAFGQWGSAGGHKTMGRAEIEEDKMPDGILLTQDEKLEGFILSSVAKIEKAFRKIYFSYLNEHGWKKNAYAST